ncbi:hypothetical protein AHMF7605_21340 [Adhaeribacter arboris]|uniref:Aerotolerance regulator N-terminal domain-containing protein n=1 Tax=Adhaeribacter arboris TaxID=2072846 RepID=A0A2T2YK34_9BACT|nr:BatA domain-containing protein [Adhaeribacter arboris]PSR55862.1 hypothetical protein AHMF7605_21340 [Adhaeribacter arboris]
MLQLLSSFWFIALAGLLVPVLIHLWNKKPPRVIKVGSIKWLAATASKKARSLRFQDWPLLLLRCLLLTVLVLFLVQPVWRQTLPPKSQKYVWVAPELLITPNLPLIQNTLDSLTQQNYELRQLRNTFPLLSAEDWINIKQGKLLIKADSGATNYWTLVQQLSHKFSTALEHLIFTPNNLNNFAGRRPVLNNTIHWVTIPTNQNKIWVQEAFPSNVDSLTVLLGRSTSSETRFTPYPFAKPISNQTVTIPDAPALLFSQEGKRAFLKIRNTPEIIEVEKDSMRVAIIYNQSRQADAGYVRATLEALRSYTHRPVAVQLSTTLNNLNSKADFLFWLSDAAIPDNIKLKLAQGLFIFKDVPTGIKSTTANWLTVTGWPASIRLSKHAPISRENSLQSWKNNYGESILHFVPAGKGGTYYFASRFNSQWNSLPESSYFPEILSSLLWPEPTIKYDARLIAETQVQPVIRRPTSHIVSENIHLRDLKYWFLLLAAILFLLERMVSFQKARV